MRRLSTTSAILVGIIGGALAMLVGCDTASRSADPEYTVKVESGVVALAAEAPDGTRLWAVTPPGSTRRVYFASNSTATTHSENCGKSCTRTVDDRVPFAAGGR